MDPFVWVGIGVPLGAALLGLWRGRHDDANAWGVGAAVLATAAVTVFVFALGGREDDVPAGQFALGLVLTAALMGTGPAGVFFVIAARLTRRPLLAAVALAMAGGLYVPCFIFAYLLAITQLGCPPDAYECPF